MRLIDADDLCPDSEWSDYEDCFTAVSKYQIDLNPTVDPVKHAHWIPLGSDDGNGNYLFLCPNCQHSDWHSRAAHVNYCWNCGAKMEASDGNE